MFYFCVCMIIVFLFGTSADLSNINISSDMSKKSNKENIYHVCGNGNDSETSCICNEYISNTLECHPVYPQPKLQHLNIEILLSNFTLEEVKLVWNDITILRKGQIFPGREKEVNLLSLCESELSVIEAESLDSFIHLKTLKLKSFSLKTIINGFFTKQIGSTLKKLDLSHNYFETFFANTFENLTALNSLALSGIPVIFTSDENIFPKSLSNLKQLNLEYCNISTFSDNYFLNLTSLKYLYLDNNPLTAIPVAINALSNLRLLDVSFSKITLLETHNFNIIPKLEQLDIMFSKLKKIENCAFCIFPNLKRFYAYGNPDLSFIHENAFGTDDAIISSMNYFDVRKSNISYLPKTISKWGTTSLTIYQDDESNTTAATGQPMMKPQKNFHSLFWRLFAPSATAFILLLLFLVYRCWKKYTVQCKYHLDFEGMPNEDIELCLQNPSFINSNTIL